MFDFRLTRIASLSLGLATGLGTLSWSPPSNACTQGVPDSISVFPRDATVPVGSKIWVATDGVGGTRDFRVVVDGALTLIEHEVLAGGWVFDPGPIEVGMHSYTVEVLGEPGTDDPELTVLGPYSYHVASLGPTRPLAPSFVEAPVALVFLDGGGELCGADWQDEFSVVCSAFLYDQTPCTPPWSHEWVRVGARSELVAVGFGDAPSHLYPANCPLLVSEAHLAFPGSEVCDVPRCVKVWPVNTAMQLGEPVEVCRGDDSDSGGSADDTGEVGGWLGFDENQEGCCMASIDDGRGRGPTFALFVVALWFSKRRRGLGRLRRP